MDTSSREVASESIGLDEPAPRRMSDTRLKERMLAAARDMVFSEAGGLEVTLERLGFEEVIRRAAVPKTSAYRLWPKKEEFYTEVLCDLAGPHWQGTAAFDQETIAVASAVVADHLHLLGTAKGRRQVFYETTRLGAKQNFDALVASKQWRTYVALAATAITLPDEEVRERVREALQQAERYFLSRMVLFYQDMSTILGVRLKPPFADQWDLLAAVGAAVVEGLGLRQLTVPSIVDREFMIPSPTGIEQPWSVPALGFAGVLEMFVEFVDDDEYDFNQRLAAYMKQISAREVKSPVEVADLTY